VIFLNTFVKIIIIMKQINFLKMSLIVACSLLISSSWSQVTTLVFTGAMETYTVPAGVTLIQIETWGAEGGTGTYNGVTPPTGLGGYAIGNLSVTPGDVLNVYVGGQGVSAGAGGFNGGGQSGSQYGASGGGASDVRIAPYTLIERVIVAGGAGGSAFGSSPTQGGAGGGLVGVDGQSISSYIGGGGGTQIAGGTAGCCYGANVAGTFGIGGGPGDYHNAGGGGGWYGGGSGGAQAAAGGGSSYIDGVTAGVTTASIQSGDGQVVITELCSGSNSAFSEDVCDAYTVPSGDTTYMVSGVYNDTIPNVTGCDSVMVITVNVTTLDLATTTTDFTISADYSGASYQWINCSDNLPIAGETNQTFTAAENGDYAVIITDGSCSDTSDCKTIAGVSINEINTSNVSLYPNPTNGEFYVSSISNAVSITVYSVDGKVIINSLNVNNANQLINLGNVENGVYFVEVTTDSNKETIRLIVK
jgi:hypothetical protein